MDTTKKPRYNRCDSCGRNAHKIALRRGREIIGFCPSCYSDSTRIARDPLAYSLDFYWIPTWAYLQGEGWEILYDRRRKAAA